jgi:hypothetical protein
MKQGPSPPDFGNDLETSIVAKVFNLPLPAAQMERIGAVKINERGCAILDAQDQQKK